MSKESEQEEWDERIRQHAIKNGFDPIIFAVFIRALTAEAVYDIIGRPISHK